MDDQVSSATAPVMQLEAAGNGPVLVLVGGGLTGALSWIPHAERLAARRLVARAQPLSVQYALEERFMPGGVGVATESRALRRGLDARGWSGPVDLVGWSYGGLISLDLALGHPDRVRTLTLVEPSAFWVLPDLGRDDPEVRKLVAMGRKLAAGVSEDDLAAYLEDIALLPPGQSAREHPRWPVWVRHRQALANGLAELEHRDDPARLRSFRRPVLLVTGDGTAPYFRRIVDGLARELPAGRVLDLPGGHAAPVVSMDRFLTELEAFLGTAGE